MLNHGGKSIAVLALLLVLLPANGGTAMVQRRDHGMTFGSNHHSDGLVGRMSNQPDAATSARVRAAFRELPLSFVPNAGQYDPAVRFHARGAGAALFFTPDQIVVALPVRSAAPRLLRLRFAGASPAPEVIGQARLPGVVNYYGGNDPDQWYTNLPTYARIIYRQLYTGIDLHYDGTNGALKATYDVAPGADPKTIRWQYEGATDVRVDETTGDLLISLGSSDQGAQAIELRESAPIAWQALDNERVPVTVRYEIDADGRIGFALPDGYDRSQPLTLDPILYFGTYLGGSDDDYGISIALDIWGNIYVAGYTASQNFPLQSPAQSFHNSADYDAFVTKFNNSGSALIYSTYLGGVWLGNSWVGDDRGRGIAVDLFGYAYVTGWTNNSKFPTTAGVFQGAIAAGTDAFVTKFHPHGALVYATYLGGNGNDYGLSIAVDFGGNAYVTGYTASTNFPTQGGFDPTCGTNGLCNGGADAFVTKLNPHGAALIYSTYLGGNGDDTGRGIAVDFFLGDAYVVGDTTSSTTFATFNAYQSTFGGGWSDAFVTKLNPQGNAMVYSTFLGGSGNDFGSGIVFDTSLNVYVTGETDSTDFPTHNPIQSANGGGADAFVTKFNSAGSPLVYSTYLGGSGADHGIAIALDSSANAYVTGYTTSANFPLAKAFSSTYGGDTDAFVTAVNAAGSAWFYSTYLGGKTHDEGSGIVVDGASLAYITGYTGGNFPAVNAYQGTYRGGSSDAFVVKLGMGSTTTTVASSSNPSVFGQQVTFTAVVNGTPHAPSSVGTVLFKDGTTTIGTVPVNAAGQASFSTSALAAGPHPITAEYLANDFFNGSTSALTQTVNKANTTTTIISSAPNPSNEGQAVTVNFSVAVAAPGAGTPTGNVTVSDGTINCVATLPATSCNLTFTNPGSRNLAATYGGNTNLDGSVSTPVVQTINNLVPTITSISPPSAIAGGAGFVLTVNGTNYFAGTIVRWNGANRTTTFVNSTQLTALITAADIATAGTASITVAHPPPAGDTSNAMTFTITQIRLWLPLILR